MDVVKIEGMANTYVVFDEETKLALAIDPSYNGHKVEQFCKEEGLTLKAILMTHGHFDHIGNLAGLRMATKALVYIHQEDAEMLTDGTKNLSIYGNSGAPVRAEPADVLLHGDEELNIAGMKVKVLHTPGHTRGSVCYMIGDCLFSGDTLFRMSIGRTDFDGGSMKDMEESLEKLGNLQDDYVLHPGHMESSSLEMEKNMNPYLYRFGK